MKTSILSYFSLLIIALSFFSCEADVKKKLIGKWKMIPVAVTPYEEDWKFTETEIIIYHAAPGDSASVFKNGTYSIKNNSISTTGEGLGSAGAEYYRGDFEIRSLTSTELVLLRKDLGLQYYEFEKIQ